MYSIADLVDGESIRDEINHSLAVKLLWLPELLSDYVPTAISNILNTGSKISLPKDRTLGNSPQYHSYHKAHVERWDVQPSLARPGNQFACRIQLRIQSDGTLQPRANRPTKPIHRLWKQHPRGSRGEFRSQVRCCTWVCRVDATKPAVRSTWNMLGEVTKTHFINIRFQGTGGGERNKGILHVEGNGWIFPPPTGSIEFPSGTGQLSSHAMAPCKMPVGSEGILSWWLSWVESEGLIWKRGDNEERLWFRLIRTLYYIVSDRR